jgi:Kef-type K+ transport system membrane component KefB
MQLEVTTMRQRSIVEVFVRAAVLLLAVTAVAKVVAASGEGRLLGRADPLLGPLSLRQGMLLAAALETAVILLLLR